MYLAFKDHDVMHSYFSKQSPILRKVSREKEANLVSPRVVGVALTGGWSTEGDLRAKSAPSESAAPQPSSLTASGGTE